MNESQEIKAMVKVYAVQKLDFKTNDGNLIQGIKVFYTQKASGDFAENFAGGQASTIFLSGKEFIDLFDSTIKTMSFPQKAELKSIFVSINKLPKPCGITFVK